MSGENNPAILSLEDAELYHRILMAAYNLGKISYSDLREFLGKMKYMDRFGNIWTIGARTGSWYQKIEDAWVPGQPQVWLLHLITFIQLRGNGDSESEDTGIPPEYLRSPIMREILKQSKKQ